ncbi:MAG: ComF family protein [Bacillota bacterium]
MELQAIKLSPLLDKLKEAILKTLYPPTCAICGELIPIGGWQDPLCEVCRKQIPYTTVTRCKQCEAEKQIGEICKNCITNFYMFHGAYYAFPYSDIRMGIHDFKFYNKKGNSKIYAELMGDFLLQNFKEVLQEIDYIHGVPMHENKIKRRGYNQADEMARDLGAYLDIPVRMDVLFRKEERTQQSRLSVELRAENIKDAFGSHECTGDRMLLVDDVFTTGSTLHECEKALYRNGAAAVYVYTLSSGK